MIQTREATTEPFYLLGIQQQCLDWLRVLEEPRLLNDMGLVLQADRFVQGAPVCKGKARGQGRTREGRTEPVLQSAMEQTVPVFPLNSLPPQDVSVCILEVGKEKPLANELWPCVAWVTPTIL